ncbi:MAG: hypothetical protein AB7P69_22735 [Candidatus Binatia bacterium]
MSSPGSTRAALPHLRLCVTQQRMPHISKDKFVQQIARNLDLPALLVERMTEPRPAGDDRNGGWKLTRMPWPEELKEFGLEARFASAGWRTALRAILED